MLPVAEEEVKVTDPPSQNVKGPLAVIVGTVGRGFTVTLVAIELDEQVPFDTTTEYDPLAVTDIDCVVAPVDQVFPVVDEEVKVTDPPAQKINGPLAVIVGIGGSGLTVTITGAEVAKHAPLETTTVYVPLVATKILDVISPFDQVFPVADEEVKVTLSPSQNVVGPLAVIVGTGGNGFTTTEIEA